MGHMDGRRVDGRAIRALRIQQGHRIVDFSKLAKVSVRYLKEIEGPVHRPNEPGRQPSTVVVNRIAAALGVSIDDFTTADDEDTADVA